MEQRQKRYYWFVAGYAVSIVLFLLVFFCSKPSSSGWMIIWFSTGMLILSTFMLAAIVTWMRLVKSIYESQQDLVRQLAYSDRRGFYLLLRSFSQTTHQEDPIAPTDPDANSALWLDYRPPFRSQIIRNLGEALSSRGRLLVIGQLFGDPLDSLDIIFIRANDYNWMSFYETLLSKCRAIIIIPGSTTSIVQEFSRLLDKGYWRKTLIVMSPESSGFERRIQWDNIRSELEKQGFNFPAYHKYGMVYLAEEDLSIKSEVPLHGETAEDFRRAFDHLLPLLPGGTSLSKVIADVIRMEADEPKQLVGQLPVETAPNNSCNRTRD